MANSNLRDNNNFFLLFGWGKKIAPASLLGG